MATPKRLMDQDEADYETLSYAAAALEKQQGEVAFPMAVDHRNAILTVLDGGVISTKDLGALLWYVGDILEDNNRRNG